MTRCQRQGCHLWTAEGQLCERCRRLMAIGALVMAVDQAAASATDLRVGLDAVAHLLTDHAVMRQRHRKEVASLNSEASSAARDGYAMGLLEGIDQRNRG